MKALESFLLGIFTAISALVVQVFFIVIFDLFFKINLSFTFSSDDSFKYVFLTIALAAVIEELLRYLVIKKVLCDNTNTVSTSVITGLFLGFGFALFETVLISFSIDITSSTAILTLLPIFAIHALLSVFLMLFIKQHYSFIKDSIFIFIAIFFHICANICIYLLQ